MTRDQQGRRAYGPGAKALHWSIAALVLFNVVVGITHEQYAQDMMRLLMGWHKAVGITVLALAILWLIVRLRQGRPQPAAIPAWQVRLSHLVHGLLFAILLIMPISGWWMSSAHPKRMPISFFGLFDVPFLPVTQGPAGFGGTFHQLHLVFGLTIVVLLALHIGAALWHEFVRRDDVMARMRPGGRARRE